MADAARLNRAISNMEAVVESVIQKAAAGVNQAQTMRGVVGALTEDLKVLYAKLETVEAEEAAVVKANKNKADAQLAADQAAAERSANKVKPVPPKGEVNEAVVSDAVQGNGDK